MSNGSLIHQILMKLTTNLPLFERHNAIANRYKLLHKSQSHKLWKISIHVKMNANEQCRVLFQFDFFSTAASPLQFQHGKAYRHRQYNKIHLHESHAGNHKNDTFISNTRKLLFVIMIQCVWRRDRQIVIHFICVCEQCFFNIKCVCEQCFSSGLYSQIAFPMCGQRMIVQTGKCHTQAQIILITTLKCCVVFFCSQSFDYS